MYVIKSKMIQAELTVYKSNTSKNSEQIKKKSLRKEVMALK